MEMWADAKPRTSSQRDVMSVFTLLPTESFVRFPKASLNPTFFFKVWLQKKKNTNKSFTLVLTEPIVSFFPPNLTN